MKGCWSCKKRGARMKRAEYLKLGALNGLSAKETLLLPVGVVYDLFELWLKANGVKEEE